MDVNSLGYWEVRVASPGRYTITFRFHPASTPGRAYFRMGSLATETSKSIQPDAGSITFPPVEFRAGEARLEAILEYGDRTTAGVDYVDVEKLAA